MIVITILRKPPNGTVVDSALEHGTGGLNIDASRIPTTDKLGGGDEKIETISSGNSPGWSRPWKHSDEARDKHAAVIRENVKRAESLGRFPANVILSHGSECTNDVCSNTCPVAAMDKQSGIRKTGKWNKHVDTAHPFGNAAGIKYDNWKDIDEPNGGASRYFKNIRQ